MASTIKLQPEAEGRVMMSIAPVVVVASGSCGCGHLPGEAIGVTKVEEAALEATFFDFKASFVQAVHFGFPQANPILDGFSNHIIGAKHAEATVVFC